jgi:predicted enzyme related to lactoylglutathione lyase
MRQFWELYVSNIDDSEAFYARAIGLSVIRRETEFVVMQADAVRIHLCAVADIPPPLKRSSQSEILGSRTEFVIEVDDVVAAYRRASTSGYRIVEPMMQREWGKIDFRLCDPDGAYIRITT